MTPIVITAVLKAKSERVEEAMAALQEVVVPSRQEKGCLTYDLHRSLDDETTFMFYEMWEDEEAVKHHTESPHYNAYRAKAVDLFEERTVYRLGKVDVHS